jgi:late competence protein required for DNA uptake (superfamily II DNA/RNA helicase)
MVKNKRSTKIVQKRKGDRRGKDSIRYELSHRKKAVSAKRKGVANIKVDTAFLYRGILIIDVAVK